MSAVAHSVRAPRAWHHKPLDSSRPTRGRCSDPVAVEPPRQPATAPLLGLPDIPYGVGQAGGIIGLDQDRLARPDHVGNAAHAGGYHRHSGAHSFEQNHGRSLGPGAEEEQVEGGEEPIRAMDHPMPAHWKVFRGGLQPLALRTVADHRQLHAVSSSRRSASTATSGPFSRLTRPTHPMAKALSDSPSSFVPHPSAAAPSWRTSGLVPRAGALRKPAGEQVCRMLSLTTTAASSRRAAGAATPRRAGCANRHQ